MLFPTVDYVRTEVGKAVKGTEAPIVIDCSHISAIDFTGIQVITFFFYSFLSNVSIFSSLDFFLPCQGIKALINDMKKNDRHIIFHTVQPDISKILLTNIGIDFLYSSSETTLMQILKG